MYSDMKVTFAEVLRDAQGRSLNRASRLYKCRYKIVSVAVAAIELRSPGVKGQLRLPILMIIFCVKRVKMSVTGVRVKFEIVIVRASVSASVFSFPLLSVLCPVVSVVDRVGG